MSMVVMTLAVQADSASEPTIVPVPPRTVLLWEKTNRGRSAALLTDDAMKLEYLYEIAWLAQGKPGDDFATYCEKTDVAYAGEISKPAEDDGPDPTRVAAFTEPSSSWPA